MKKTTARQVEILKIIVAMTEAEGLPPSRRELGERLGIKSGHGVQCHLDALEKKGLIKRRPRVSRALFVTSQGRLAIKGGD